ncbi:hypothetical protein BD410DRAFT_717704 [Rickenella mellea]|uniref:Mitochondrial F1F0-ATP synthase g subunit n=1 Tax=Rickenella mellea TaxID=50990 RepID=A0A4Y7QE80_9AGAM|nr:hypothetical protein BD410DRAFT_717704 [Rickenella mellea]
MVRPTLSALRAPTARPRRLPQQRRFASTSSPNPTTTTEAAQKKAQDALASAQVTAQKALDGAKKIGGSLGERIGSMLGSYRQPLTYNLSVGRELLKQVYIAERLQPPTSLSQFTNAYSTIWSRASNPSYWREVVKNGQWAKIGIYGLEAYGIFKIGEIIGRRHLVGYSLN